MWVDVLVDCPGEASVLTYEVPSGISVNSGTVVLVPWGKQMLSGIVVNTQSSFPVALAVNQIKPLQAILTDHFFPPRYWNLLLKVAQYYCTDLITVLKAALPPGLLGKSQPRVRLAHFEQRVLDADLSLAAQQIFKLLNQPGKSYSLRHLRRRVSQADQGLRELTKRGYLERYLRPPASVKPKCQKAVLLANSATAAEPLTPRQQDVLMVLQRRGVQIWLSELLQLTGASSTVVTALARKGYVVVSEQEKLRLSQDEVAQDCPKILTLQQEAVLSKILHQDSYQQFLLHGVTGSGKTEIYLQAIAPILARGQSALVLVPEIGLTPQLTERFRSRFGKRVWVYHSGLGVGERYDTWRELLRGEPVIVIGTRSAVFTPIKNLGLIVLDEEHDASFKQTTPPPTYHARRVAQWRAEMADCAMILGTATPAIETWQCQLQQQVQYLSLPERISGRPLPPVEVVDMRQELQSGNYSCFSRPLQQQLRQLSPHQAILFVSRRGHSTFVSCRSCGSVLECPHCDVSLSYHYAYEGAHQSLRCHYCNYQQPQPSFCPHCQSPYLKHFGNGTQRVCLDLNKEFPALKTLRFDSDTTSAKDAHRHLLRRFAEGQADVLVGTQMLTKGLDVPNVTLVGILAADSLLFHADYRAAERACQILLQVAGRAGRGDYPGQVILQTYAPEHPVIQAVAKHSYQQFLETELPQRKELSYPPFGLLVLLRLSSPNAIAVEQTAAQIAAVCRTVLSEQAEILGPAPAPIPRIARRYRWQVLLKFPMETVLPRSRLRNLKTLCPSGVSLSLDIDPQSLD
ncbi:MAG: primosomal protein N' [Cyanobacteria bacterium P01_H01_bin.15]